MGAGADNIVGLVNSTSITEYSDPNNPTVVQGKAYQVNGESFDRIVIATKSGDPNLGGHETGHAVGAGGHLEDGVLPLDKIIPGIMSARGPSTGYMASQDFDHLFSRPLSNHRAGVLETVRVQSSVRSFTIVRRNYPSTTTREYRTPAAYNRNVVPFP